MRCTYPLCNEGVDCGGNGEYGICLSVCLFVQPQLPYFVLTRNRESVSSVSLHSPTHPTALPTRFLFVRLPTRLSISCAFFPPQIPANKRREREKGSRDGQTDKTGRKANFAHATVRPPASITISRSAHCSVLAHRFRPTASFSLEVT